MCFAYGTVIDQYKTFFEFLFSNGYINLAFDDDIDKPKYIANVNFNRNLFNKEDGVCKKLLWGKALPN